MVTNMRERYSTSFALLLSAGLVVLLIGLDSSGAPNLTEIAEKPDKGGNPGVDNPEVPYKSGLLLRTPKAEIVKYDGQRLLRTQWNLIYKGSRVPLAIRKPTLTEPMGTYSRIVVYALGSSGTYYDFLIPAKKPDSTESKKDWFTEIPRGQMVAEGTIDIPFDRLKNSLLKYYPEEFSKSTPPKMYVLLELDIIDRGEQFELDAWTGWLRSHAAKVECSQWK